MLPVDMSARMCRSPAEERAVIKERLDQAQQGLLKSTQLDTNPVDGGSFLSTCILHRSEP